VSTSTVADHLGLDTRVVRSVLQNLASTGIVQRSGDSNSLKWKIDDRYIETMRRIFGTSDTEKIREAREIAEEEKDLEDEIF
jgi:predicted ArsR family transcriptional regulator